MKRIKLQVKTTSNSYEPIDFTKCLVSQLTNSDDGGGSGAGWSDSCECRIGLAVDGDCYYVFSADQESSGDENISNNGDALFGSLMHPSFCPILCISDDDRASLHGDTAGRGVEIGVTVVLESSDGRILLTRRSSNLSTFPGLWVPPGGHIELGETVVAAGLRELHEETGLKVTEEDSERKPIALAFWESVYPPILGMGLPRRHHLVVYLHVKSRRTWLELQSETKLQPAEVESCVWLSRDMVGAILGDETVSLPPTVTMLTVDAAGVHTQQEYDPGPMLYRYKGKGNDATVERERVSTGSRYAMAMWAKHSGSSSTSRNNSDTQPLGLSSKI